MATWAETIISGRHVVQAISDEFALSFYREADRSGWASLIAYDGTGLIFDEHRPPVLIIDGSLGSDLAISKSLNEIESHLDLGARPTYIGEAGLVMGRVWHGRNAEGLGLFGKLIEGRELDVIIYRANYDVSRTSFPLDSSDLFQKVLQV